MNAPQRRKYQTTADVEAHYQTHPPDHKDPAMSPWLRASIIWLWVGAAVLGGVIVLGLILVVVGS